MGNLPSPDEILGTENKLPSPKEILGNVEPVKKKDGTQEVTKPLNNGSAKSDVSQLNSNSQSSTSNSNSVSPLINNGVVPDFKSFDPTNGFGRNKLLPIDEKKKQAVKQALGTPTTVVEPQKVKTETPIETPQYDVSGATKQQSDNTDTRLVNVSQQAESKRVAQEAEKVKREQELANPNSFQNIGTSYKEKALKTTGNNDIEKMLNFGDINGNKAFVEATLDDNDKHILGVTKEIEKINNDNKIYEQQLKSGAITQEIYDAHKKENTKKSIDLNAEYVKGIQSRNSAIDDEIKQSQTKLANGYDIKMLGAQPYSEPLTTQQIDEEKKKIKTLTDLKNDVLIDVNNPVKSLEKHEGFQNAEKEGLIPNGATNTQKVRIYSYILADKAKKLATELGYNPNDVKSLMGDKFGSNTPKMWWEQLKSLVVGSNPKEKEYVHTMAELQAIAPIAILNKNNLTLNEGYTSNLVSSFRKSVAPLFVRNQIATDQDRNALTKEAFGQAGITDNVSKPYTTQQGNVEAESKTVGKSVSRTVGDIGGIGVKIAGINTILGIPGAAIESASGKPIFQALDKALSTSREAQALEYSKLSESVAGAKTVKDVAQISEAKKVLDIAKVVSEKLPNNFLTRTVYGTVKAGTVHEIQGRVNKELKGFANFGVGSVNHLIGMPINSLGQVAIRLFGKDAPTFVRTVIQATQAGTAMTGTMAGMTVVNAARETEDMSAFKDVLDQHFGTKDKALRFVGENFLLGLTLHAANLNTVSGIFKSRYDESYSKLSDEQKAKVDEFVADANEKTNEFESETKDAVSVVEKDDHKPLTTDKELEDGINEFKDAEKIPSLSVGDNKDGNKITRISEDGNDVFIQDKDGKVERYSPEEASKILGTNVLPENKVKTDESQIKPVEPTNAGQELNNGTGMAGSKQDAKIESAVIEIGGKIYEGKNHAEAILKAKADGQDISQVNRQAEGKFKLSDGTIIDRAESKSRFGQDRSELIIPQDEAAKQANKDYAEITKGLKNEQTNQNTPEQQDNGNSTGMAGSEQDSETIQAESEQGKLSNEDKIQQNATTEVQKQITEVEKIISELEDNPNSPFHKLVNLDEQKQKLSELQKQEAEVKKESAQPVLPETKAQKAANPNISALPKRKIVPTEKTETTENPALKDVEATAKALDGVDLTTKIPIQQINELNKQLYNNLFDKHKELLAKGERDFDNNEEIKSIKEQIAFSEALIKNDTKAISEAYHKAKADGSNPELVKAVEQSLKAEDKAPVTKPEGKSDVVVDKASNVGGDVESTTKALEDISKNKPTIWQSVKDAFNKGVNKVFGGSLKMKDSEKLSPDKIKARVELIAKKLGATIEYKPHPLGAAFNIANDGKFYITIDPKLFDKGLGNQEAFNTINVIAHELGHAIDAKEVLKNNLSDTEISELAKLHRAFINTFNFDVGEDISGLETAIKNNNKNITGDEKATKISDLRNPETNAHRHEQEELFADALRMMVISPELAKRLAPNLFERLSKHGLGDNEYQSIAEAYHDAKSKGKENDFTKAVEQSLSTQEGSGVGGDVVKPTFENVPILTRTAEEIETAKNEVFNNLNRLEVGSVIENSDGEIKVVTEKSTDKKGNQLIGIVTYERQSDGSLRQMTNIVWASKSADGKIKLDYNPHSTGTNLKGERVTVTDQITDKKIDLSKENIFTEDENGNLIQINKVEPSLKETTKAETPKVVFDEAFQWYKDNDYTYEEAKKELDDNNIDYNEQDLKDAFGVKDVPPVDNGNKKQDSGGNGKVVEKTLLKKRIYDNPNSIEEFKQELQKYDLTRKTIPHEEARYIASDIISKNGLDNALDGVRKGDIKGGVAQEIYYAKFKEIEAKINDSTSSEDKTQLVGEKAMLASEWSLFNTHAGQQSSQMADIYKRDDNLLFNAEIQKEQYRENNGGELPKHIEEKFDSLSKTIEDANKRITELETEQKAIEDKYKDSISKEEADKHIIEAYEKGKKNGSAGKAGKISKAKIEKANAKIAQGMQDFLQAIGGLNMAVGNVMPSITKALKAIGEGLIDKGLATVENVFDKIIEHITSETGKKPDIENYRSEFENKKDDKGLKVANSRIKEIVETRRLDGKDTTIDDVVEELKNDYPDATDREIRDVVTGYGKTSELKGGDDATVRKIKRMGRYQSIMEDILNKKRPLRSGTQRDKIEADERAKLKEIYQGLKNLPIGATDLSKQLKAAQDAIETHLKNSIEDLDRQIKTGERPVKNKAIETTPRIEELRKERDRLLKQRNEIDNPPKSDLERLIDKAIDFTNKINQAKKEGNKKDEKALQIQKEATDGGITNLVDAVIKMNTNPAEVELARKIKAKENEISKLEEKLNNNDLSKPENKDGVTSPELDDLTKQKNALVKELAKRRSAEEQANLHSDTLQELQDNADISGETKITKADVDNGLISDLVQAHIEKGTPIEDVQKQIFNELKSIFPNTTERQVSDAITRSGEYKAEPKEQTDLQKKVGELKKQLNYQTKIEDIQKGIIAETKKNGDSEKAKELRKQLSDAKKEAANTYPEVSANELQKKIERTQKSIDEYNRKVAQKEFVKTQTVKKEFHNNPEWVKKNKELYQLQMAKAKAKAEFENEKDKLADKEKSNTEKVGEFLGKLKRFDIFTSFFGMGRLALAAVTRPLTLPLRESAKYLLSRNIPDFIRNKTGLSLPTANIMEKSAGNYRKDISQSLRYMGDYYASYFGKKIYKDAISEFNKRSNYSLEKDVNGKDRYRSFTGRILSAPEQAHGFMKAFAKLPQYNATFNVALENMNRMIDRRTGKLYDITDPYVQSLAMQEAKREADADVFMENSDLARANSALWSGMSKSDNYVVQLAGIYGKQLEPVIKVPVNFFSEVIQGFPLVGFADAIQTIARSGDIKDKKTGGYRGSANLTPEQAHLASRKLTNQIVGFMGVAIGMSLYKLYKDDAIKKLEDVKHWAHNTSFPLIMMGLDLAKAMEEEDSAGDVAKIPYKEAKKLATALPQYRSMKDYVFTTEKSLGQRAKGLLIPTVLKELGIVKGSSRGTTRGTDSRGSDSRTTTR